MRKVIRDDSVITCGGHGCSKSDGAGRKSFPTSLMLDSHLLVSHLLDSHHRYNTRCSAPGRCAEDPSPMCKVHTPETAPADGPTCCSSDDGSGGGKLGHKPGP